METVIPFDRLPINSQYQADRILDVGDGDRHNSSECGLVVVVAVVAVADGSTGRDCVPCAKVQTSRPRSTSCAGLLSLLLAMKQWFSELMVFGASCPPVNLAAGCRSPDVWIQPRGLIKCGAPQRHAFRSGCRRPSSSRHLFQAAPIDRCKTARWESSRAVRAFRRRRCCSPSEEQALCGKGTLCSAAALCRSLPCHSCLRTARARKFPDPCLQPRQACGCCTA